MPAEEVKELSEEIKKTKKEIILDNDIKRILISLCKLNNIDNYLYILKNTYNLNSESKKMLDIFLKLYEQFNKVPLLNVFLREINLEDKFDESYFYTEEEINDILLLIDKNNIKHTILEKLRVLTENIKNDTFDESILDEIYTLRCKLNDKGFDLDSTFSQLRNHCQKKEEIQPILIGIKELDNNEIYFYKGDIEILMGATGNFKTTFAINYAYNCIRKGMNVCVLSLEIPATTLYLNLLSLHSYKEKFNMKLEQSKIRSGNLDKEEEKILFDEIYTDFSNKLKKHLIIVDNSNIPINTFSSYNDILGNVNRKFIRDTSKPIDILIVDHIQMLKHNTDMITDQYHVLISKWVDYFRRNSLDFLGTKNKISTLLISQVSREGYKESKRNYGNYSLNALADSVDIERMASTVLSICSDILVPSSVEISVLKSRYSLKKDKKIYPCINPDYYAFGDGYKHNEYDEDLSENSDPNKTNNSEDNLPITDFSDLLKETPLPIIEFSHT